MQFHRIIYDIVKDTGNQLNKIHEYGKNGLIFVLGVIRTVALGIWMVIGFVALIFWFIGMSIDEVLVKLDGKHRSRHNRY